MSCDRRLDSAVGFECCDKASAVGVPPTASVATPSLTYRCRRNSGPLLQNAGVFAAPRPNQRASLAGRPRCAPIFLATVVGVDGIVSRGVV
jgi:hypothetical protein